MNRNKPMKRTTMANLSPEDRALLEQARREWEEEEEVEPSPYMKDKMQSQFAVGEAIDLRKAAKQAAIRAAAATGGEDR